MAVIIIIAHINVLRGLLLWSLFQYRVRDLHLQVMKDKSTIGV